MAVPINMSANVANPDLLSSLLFSTCVIYGPTGSRKTGLGVRGFVEYIYERTGKKTRLITADGGGYAPLQDLVNIGILEPWRITQEPGPMSIIKKAGRGAWPKNLSNGISLSGLIEPTHSKLSESMKDVGGYVLESWWSIASLVMSYMITAGIRGSEDIVEKVAVDDEGNVITSERIAALMKQGKTADLDKMIQFGSSSRSHYNMTQRFILDMIRDFSALPVERVLFTSIESRGEDKISKSTVYGPMVAGSAITAAVPTHVGDCLHLSASNEEAGTDSNNPKQKLTESKVRAWFTSHPDVQTPNIMWPAKCRIITTQWDAFKKEMGANGYFNLENGSVYRYLKLQDEFTSKATEEARAWKNKIDASR